MRKPSKIVVLHDSIQARGGATALALLSARLYKELGYDVTYITGAQNDHSLDDSGIDVRGMGIGSLASQSGIRAMVSGLYNSTTVRVVSDWISEHDTPETVYHLHNWAQALSPTIFKALRPVARRTIVSCHDLFNVCPNGGMVNFKTGQPCELKPMSTACWTSQCDRRSSIHKYWRMMRQVLLNQIADFEESEMTFVSLHDGMTDAMLRAGFSGKRILSNPNPAQGYTNERVLSERNKGFIFIGRLSKEKGADIAVEAAKHIGAPLTLIGEGELAQLFVDLPQNIKLAGFCSKKDIVGYARNARAIIVSGRWPEPYGLVIAEAALSGIPIIISEPSLLAKSIVELEMGEVFSLNGSPALSTVMERWRDDDNLVKTYSENAFARAESICSTPEQWARRFIDLFAAKLNHDLENH